MPIVCPKCNAVRPSETPAPDWQCPACGVAYAKVGGEPPLRGEAPRSRYLESAAQSDGIPWRKLFGVLLAALALYAGYQAAHNKVSIGGSLLDSGASLSEQQVADLAAVSQPQDVLFYTADWCPYCRAAKGWMQQYGFKYQECDVDKQAGCAQQLLPKRAAHYLWAVLIARIYEVFPLLCPLCGGQMRCRRRCVRHGILQLRHGRGEARHETLRCREWLLRLAPASTRSYRRFLIFASDIAAGRVETGLCEAGSKQQIYSEMNISV